MGTHFEMLPILLYVSIFQKHSVAAIPLGGLTCFLKVNFKCFMDFIHFRSENSPVLPFTEKREKMILYHSVFHLYRQLKKVSYLVKHIPICEY